jgi:hypothetical protein
MTEELTAEAQRTQSNPELPDDLEQAFVLLESAIVRHQSAGWKVELADAVIDRLCQLISVSAKGLPSPWERYEMRRQKGDS